LEYAHIEEIRNALRIFNESHRVHRSPNIDHNPVFALPRNGNPKVSIAFGHSFGWSEYFLASAFSNVHLQPRGHLALGGTTVSNIFLRDMLVKYGIKAHVFKHGDYKSE
jgi:protease-4